MNFYKIKRSIVVTFESGREKAACTRFMIISPLAFSLKFSPGNLTWRLLFGFIILRIAHLFQNKQLRC